MGLPRSRSVGKGLNVFRRVSISSFNFFPYRIFNIFSASDPIGTRLNSTVDAEYAKTLSSITLTRATKSILRTLPDTLNAAPPSTGLFGSWNRSTLSNMYTASKDEVEAKSESEEVPDDAEALFGVQAEAKKLGASLANKARGGFEEKWKDLKKQAEDKMASEKKKEAEQQGNIERDRAERRMNALCEFGSVGESRFVDENLKERSKLIIALPSSRFYDTLADFNSHQSVHGVSVVARW